MSYIYILSVLYLFIALILIKKTDKKINIFNTIIITLISFLCYNVVTCYILKGIKINIDLLSLSLINIILSTLFLIKIIKDKKIQKFYINKKDIIFLILTIILILSISYIQFGKLDSIKYYTTDAKVHFEAANSFYKNDIKLTNTVLPFAYINEGIAFKAFEPIIGEFNLYKIFLLSDILILFFAMTTFYMLFNKENDTWIKFIIICISSIIYTLGYPLNSMLTGFHYLQAGINLILIIIYLLNSDDFKYKNILLFLLNLCVMFSYILFAPLIYIAEFLYYLIKNKKNDNKLISKRNISEITITLIVPGILGTLWFMIPKIFFSTSSMKEIMLDRIHI